jgi:hypothetical protein
MQDPKSLTVSSEATAGPVLDNVRDILADFSDRFLGNTIIILSITQEKLALALRLGRHYYQETESHRREICRTAGGRVNRECPASFQPACMFCSLHKRA